MGMHSNSLAAYRRHRFGSRCQAIMQEIYTNGPGTCRELVKRLGLHDMNEVRPRVTELKQIGALVEVKKRLEKAYPGAKVNEVSVFGLPQPPKPPEQPSLFDAVKGLVTARNDAQRVTGEQADG